MRATLLIAADSVRGLLHRRLLVALMLGMLGLTAGFSVLQNRMLESVQVSTGRAADASEGEIDEDQARQMRQNADMAGTMFMAGLYWFATLGGAAVALFICCTAVSAEIRQGTISIVLAKPVTRTQFLLGKYVGAVAVLCGYSALAGVAMVSFAYAHQSDLTLAARYAPWLMFCQNLMVGSAALFLSLLMHPLVAAVVAYFASASFFSSPNPLYFVLPSYDRFNVASLIMQGRLIAFEDVVVLSLYAFDVATIFVLLALWRFRTRELL